MAETPIEMLHLPEQLRHLFSGKLPQATSGTAEERERNFLSRALAAYAIHKLASCSIDEATAAVIDGGGDGGIDAIHHAAATHVLWIAQSKFIATGRGEPELGDVTKFKAGLENLLQGNFSAFRENASWTARMPQIEAVFGDDSLQVRALLVYSGINIVSEDRRRLFEDLKKRFSPDCDYLDVYTCSLTTVHDWIIGADQGPGVLKVELTLLKPGWVSTPYETVFGMLHLKDLAAIYVQHGKRLVAANLRAYKGRTEVNEQILATVEKEAEHFFYLNNGLTAYCERLEVNNLDRANADSKRLTAYGFSVINGAQTLGSVAEFFRSPPEPVPEGFVLLKVISLERCQDDRAFAERITRSTNFQNQIGSREFVALDPQQEAIANQLKLTGVEYHYKEDVDAPAPDATNFTLEEATTASACLVQSGDCELCARILANRRSLWSMEDTYPKGELRRSVYSRVFRAERSARAVWRAVQAQRLVVKVMQDNGRASSGIRKAFFDNARWLVLNVLFLKLHPERGEDVKLTAEEEAEVSKMALELAEALWVICEAKGYVARRANVPVGTETYEQTRHFRSVFSAAGDCQILRAGLLAKLSAQSVVGAAASVSPPSTANSSRGEE
jgi:hypothetical protein